MADRRRFLRLCSSAGIGVLTGCAISSEDTGPTARDSPTAPPGTPVRSPTATLTPTRTPTPTETQAPTTTPGPTTTTPGDGRQVAKLTPTDGDREDLFGASVAASADGTTVIVGAVWDDDPNGPGAGSAYVFEASGGGWTQRTKLVPDDGTEEDRFGAPVALSQDGTTAIVGAVGTDQETGAAYVFEAGEDWPHQATLASEDGERGDYFGSAAALSADGTTAVVGAYRDQNPDSGSAYVFEHDGDWRQRATLHPDDGTDEDRFGYPVAVSADGTTAVVGAILNADPNGMDAGSAYVFESDGGWRQRAKLLSADGDSGDWFGHAIAVSRDATTAIVGAPRDEDPNGTDAGAAYVFEYDGGWRQRTKLVPDDGDGGDRFGHTAAVSADGTIAVIGAVGDEDPNGEDAGSAYVFESNGDWRQRAKLAPDDGDSGDRFGISTAITSEGTTALIGAAGDADPNGADAGSAYVFTL